MKNTNQLSDNMEYLFYNIKHNVKNLTPDYILTNKENTVKLIAEEINDITSKLSNGSLIFISGLPFILGNVTEFLTDELKFNYWISCEYLPANNDGDFPLTHFGLLFLQKKESKKPIPFKLNTKEYRVPHTTCPSCNKLTKDWGGKKHTMNPLGTAYSDVWYIGGELDKINDRHNKKIENIIHNLIGIDKKLELINSDIVYDDRKIKTSHNIESDNVIQFFECDNKVVNDDCVSFIDEVVMKHPNGVFDIAFSDPPYNLNKNYSKYEDNLRDKEYLDWCEKWLYSKYQSLKHGGSLLVMNIPKWSIHHFNFLKKFMFFDKWIVWDALSTPAGKLMPAHYTILHFVKPGGRKKISKTSEMIPEKSYCLRNTCISKRKDIQTVEVTDIWKDCHRVKHNKNKNDHPCQLPIKLLDRLINKYSNENDRIFDPFGGTGSAAVSSKINNRNFTITDIDDKYCNIAETNISRVKENLLGIKEYILEPTKRESKTKSKYNIKLVEESYMSLCEKSNKLLTLEEVLILDVTLHSKLLLYPKKFSKLQSMTTRLKLV
jgi:site-specific DNA-methyltransferase (adenine-specific)